MFNLDLSHWPAALFAFFPLLLNAGILGYIFVRRPKTGLYNIFSLLLVTLIIWQFTDTMVRISATVETAMTWYELLSPFANFILPFALHFALRFIQRERLLERPWILPAIYLPALFFFIATTGGFVTYHISEDAFWRWVITPARNLLTLLNAWWISGLGLLLLSLLLRFAFKKKGSPLLNRQAALVAVGFAIPTALGIVTELIMPYFADAGPIPVTSATMGIFSLCIVIALTRYRLFSYSPRHEWKQIMDSMNEGIMIVDNNDIIRFVNPRLCKMLGYTANELKNRHGSSLLLKGGDKHTMAQAILRRKEGKSDKYEIPVVTRSGAGIICEISGSPYTDNTGKTIGSVGIMTDITRRKQAETVNEIALEISNLASEESGMPNYRDFGAFILKVREKISRVVDASNFYIAIYNRETGELEFPLIIDRYLSKGSVKHRREYSNGITEYLINRGTTLLLKRQDIEELAANREITMHGRLCEQWLGVPLQMDGQIVGAMVIQSYEAPIYNDDTCRFMKDISNYVARAMEKLRTERQLYESEERHRIFIERSLLTIYSFDPDTGIIFDANPSFFKLLGYTRNDLGTLTTFQVGASSDDEIRELIDKYKMGAGNVVRERQWKTKYGETFDMLVTVNYIGQQHFESGLSPLVGRAGASVNGNAIPSVIFVTGMDITKRKQLETSLRQKISDLNIFTYRASHDLKAPLCTIMGLVDMGCRETKDKETVKLLDMIGTCTARLDRILQELTDIVHITQHNVETMEINLKFEIKEILASLSSMQNFDKVDKKVKINLDSPLRSDAKLLKPILQNLLSNAICYAEFKNSNPYLSVTAKNIPGYVRITVKDNGLGIAKEHHQKVWDMFYRANESSSGTGLGLFIVRNAVEKLKGSITLRSVLGEGATFTVLLQNTAQA